MGGMPNGAAWLIGCEEIVPRYQDFQLYNCN
jgi:hypothetical protein